MIFEFNGIKFRIFFRHDRSRRMSDHVGHQVRVGRSPGYAEAVIAGHNPQERIGLWCDSCKLMIGDVPKHLRQRLTHATIQLLDESEMPGAWVDVVHGMGRPHSFNKYGLGGDQFSTKPGRVAALSNLADGITKGTLEHLFSDDLLPEFKAAIWTAYNTRAKGARK